jgi:hypothetical protein
MFRKKASILVSSVALLVIGACGSVALAASAPHRGHAAAQPKAAAPVPPGFNSHYPYAWMRSNEPTYMAIQDQFHRDGSSEK